MTNKPAQQIRQNRDPVQERMQAIIEGAEPAPSELCEYLAQAIRDGIAERDGLVKRITEAEQFLAQFKNRLAAVSGVLQKSSDDLRKKLTGDKPVLRPVENEQKDPPKESESEVPHEAD